MAVWRGLAAAWVMRLLFGARALKVCRHRTESWCVLASGPPVTALAHRPPGLWHLRVFTAVRWSDVSEPTKMRL